MAGKNEVTLTFAGDADKLEKEIRRVTSGTDSLESAFKRVGAAADSMDSRLGGAVSGASRLDKLIGQGGRKFGDYGTGLGGASGRAEEFEDRMMGLGGGISSVNDLMHRGQTDAAGMAMALSDLGMFTRYTVIPSLIDGAKGFQNMTKQMGGMKGLLTGGAIVAGIGAVAFGLKQIDEARTAKRVDEINQALEETGRLSNETAEKMLYAASETGKFDKMLAQVAEGGGYKAAEMLVEQAELLGADRETMARLRGELSELRQEYDTAAENIEKFNDALQEQQDKQAALTDPMFDFINSTNELADAKAEEASAQQALNDALASGDPSAITDAQNALRDAHLGVSEAAFDSEQAQETLMGALATGQTTVDEMRARVDELESSGRLSGDAAGYLRDQINSIESKDVKITANIWNATQGIGTVQERLASLKDKRVQIDIAYTSYGVAEANRARAMSSLYSGGGVVYAASGHPGMPRGTDTVPAWLTPGEMVLNKAQQENLFDAINSGAIGGGAAVKAAPVVHVHVAGSVLSERDLVKVIRDEVARGGFRGALR